MDLLLHPRDDRELHRPDPRGRLSTVGHGEAFRALAKALGEAGIRFMVIGGTFRDIAIRASSTRDIDIVLVDCKAIPARVMEAAGFRRVPKSRWAWRTRAAERTVEVQVAALASTSEPSGPFSVAVRHAKTAMIEGIQVPVPRIEDYVILKLLAAAADSRRRTRDLVDVQSAIEAHEEHRKGGLSVAAIRARVRDAYGIKGRQLNELVGLFREASRSS